MIIILIYCRTTQINFVVLYVLSFLSCVAHIEIFNNFISRIYLHMNSYNNQFQKKQLTFYTEEWKLIHMLNNNTCFIQRILNTRLLTQLNKTSQRTLSKKKKKKPRQAHAHTCVYIWKGTQQKKNLIQFDTFCNMLLFTVCL